MAHSETRIAGKYRQEQIIKILSLLGYFQGWATKNKWFATTTTHKKRKQKKTQNKTTTSRKWRIYGQVVTTTKVLGSLVRSKFREEKRHKKQKKKRHRPNA